MLGYYCVNQLLTVHFAVDFHPAMIRFTAVGLCVVCFTGLLAQGEEITTKDGLDNLISSIFYTNNGSVTYGHTGAV